MPLTLEATHSVSPVWTGRLAPTVGAPTAPVGPAALLDLVPSGAWATTDGLRAYYSLVTAEGVDLATLYRWLADLAGQGLLERERPLDEPRPEAVALLRWRRA